MNPSAEVTVKNIRQKKRKKYSVEEKIRIVLEGLRGMKTIAKLCRYEEIQPKLILQLVQRIPGSVQTTSIRERCQISDHQSGQKHSERTVPDETDGGRAVTEQPGAEKKLALSLFFCSS